MMRKYFGTDGVRGPYGGPLINEAFAEKLGVAAGRFASRTQQTGALRVVMGRDTRASGIAILDAVASGLASVGLDCVILDIVPTPAVACAVVRESAALGVMITASHNPADDNGIKFFGADGCKLSDLEEAEIERLIPDEAPTIIPLGAKHVNGQEAYLERLRGILPRDGLKNWKIVLDTANGATIGTSPRLLRELGADLDWVGDVADGNNINAGVGSEHPALLQSRVKATSARIGIAHDGDGDRCVLCDETGSILDGDEILTLLAMDALERGVLGNQTLVVTVQSNLGVDSAIKHAGGRVVRTAVGDRYVTEKMRAEGSTLGGESSGHVICSEVGFTGDGLATALNVLRVMLRKDAPLSQLRLGLKKAPQASRNLRVKEKRELSALPHFPFAVQAIERELGDKGRVLARYSGTEPKLRLLVEGPTIEVVERCIERLVTVASTDLEVIG